MSYRDERPKERFIPNPTARLGDQVREVMRFKHYALRTEQTYWSWIRQYIFFHPKRPHTEHGHRDGQADEQAMLAERILYEQQAHANRIAQEKIGAQDFAEGNRPRNVPPL